MQEYDRFSNSLNYEVWILTWKLYVHGLFWWSYQGFFKIEKKVLQKAVKRFNRDPLEQLFPFQSGVHKSKTSWQS